MKIQKYVKRLSSFTAILFFATHAAQALDSSGVWNSTTISADETVNLTGNVQVTGQITINEDASLTINNTTGTQITIENSAADGIEYMFRLMHGAKLVIEGTESGRIVIDGKAGMTWNDADYTLTGDDESKSFKTSLIGSIGTVELRYVTIRDVLSTHGAFYVNDYYGNPVKVGTTTIENCEFDKCCTSWTAGGAITISANIPNAKEEDFAVRVSKTSFTHCVGEAGAIRTYGPAVANMYLTNCVFEKNFSKVQGGAVIWNAHGLLGTKLSVDGCTFRYNKSTTNGGAMFLEGSYTFVNNVTEIYNNTAGTYGGGVCIAGYANPNYVSEAHLTFEINDFMNVHDNIAGKRGGGLAVTFPNGMSLTEGSSLTCSITGGTIEENGAGEDGGGIYFENLTPAGKYAVSVSLEGGAIQNNTAKRNGGGICAVDFDIKGKDVSNPLRVQLNRAEGSGGGIYMKNKSMSLAAVTVYKNTAMSDGGGIYVESGDFSILSGGILNNTSTNRGGGLFVINETDNVNLFSLESGMIFGNTTGLAGGGVYAYGHARLDVKGADIEYNEASNGGGIMVKGISSDKPASMTYSSGVIYGNRAKSNGTPIATAYQTTVENLNGIGGGIIVGAYANIAFDIKDNSIGIYDNVADNGADDVFSSSEISSITLPDVQNMSLSGSSEAREHTLFWVEDYITNDTNYDKGTYMKGAAWSSDRTNQRYRDVRDGKVQNGAIYQVPAGTYNKYLSLTIGWSSSYIILEKKGLSPRDNAIFKFYRDGTEFMTVILTDKDTCADGTRRKTIKLEDGEWTIVETAWSWAYTADTNSITRKLTQYSTPSERTFTFSNTPVENTPSHAESVKVNELIP